jgi:hypothetical protein
MRRLRSALCGCVGLAVAAALALVTAPCAAQAAEPEYTLETITGALKEWQSQIVTLRLQMREEADPHSNLAKEAKLEGVERVEFFDWTWTDTGAGRSHNWVTYDGKVQMRNLAAGGPRSWSCTYRDGPSDEREPATVTLQAGSSGPPGGALPTPLYGLWTYAPRSAWLVDRIERGDFELVGTVKAQGHPRVRLRNIDEKKDSLLLDPEHGFLTAESEVPGGNSQVVDEFFEPEPGLFFPKRGRLTQRSGGEVLQTITWEVLSAELNQPIADELWEPPIADGTQVADVATGKVYVQGGKAFKPEIVQTITDAANELPPGAPATATPSGTTSYWSGGLVLLAFVLLIAAVLCRRAGR